MTATKFWMGCPHCFSERQAFEVAGRREVHKPSGTYLALFALCTNEHCGMPLTALAGRYAPKPITRVIVEGEEWGIIGTWPPPFRTDEA